MYSASNDYNINASIGSEKSSKIFYKDKNIFIIRNDDLLKEDN